MPTEENNFLEEESGKVPGETLEAKPEPEGKKPLPTEPPKELKELLKRGEIVTMQKEIARLREIEARKERERIAAIKTEEEVSIEKEKKEKAEKLKKELEERRITEERMKTEAAEKEIIEKLETPEAENEEKLREFAGEKTREIWQKEEKARKEFLERVRAKETSPLKAPETEVKEAKIEETIIPEPPQKPSFYQKILARAVLTIALFFIFSFIYWYFAVREKETPQKELTPPPAKQEVAAIAPLALISVDATSTIEVSTKEEIPAALSQFLAKNSGVQGFTRILIKDIGENKIIGLKDFFEALEVKTPAELLDRLDDRFTLFMYSSNTANRLGFVTKIAPEDNVPPQKRLANLSNFWEPTMEKDTEELFKVLGKTAPASQPQFKTAVYRGLTFRYLSFQAKNLGICWSVSKDYFIWTTSGESIMQVINNLLKEKQ